MLIIDGDLYVYKAGFAMKGKEVGFKIVRKNNLILNETIDFGNISLVKAKEKCKSEGYKKEDWELIYYNNPFPLHFIIEKLDQKLTELMERFQNPEYRMYITSSDYSNYRYNIATITPYKGSRRLCVKCFAKCKAEFNSDRTVKLLCKNCGEVCRETTFADRPTYYNEIRDHLVNNWGAELVYDQEADDAVSIDSFKYRNSIIVHIDKDINNTPGKHYNPDSDKLYIVSEKDAYKNFYYQMLTGDSIDCIPGVPGIGPILSRTILDDCDSREDHEIRIMEVFQGEFSISKFNNKMNLTPEEAYARLKEVGQLLWIRREENELWIPTIKM